MENDIQENETVIEDPKAVLAALDRAKNDAKKFREEKESLESALASKDQAINVYTNKLIQEKIAQKIASEGIKDPQRVMKFVKMENLSLDENFDLVGFEDQIEELKQDLPEVFDPKLRVGGQADAAIQATVSTRFSASEMQAAKILGKIK
jgi:hypothetical protein